MLNPHSECQQISTLTEYQLVFHWVLTPRVIFLTVGEDWHAMCNLYQSWSNLRINKMLDWHLDTSCFIPYDLFIFYFHLLPNPILLLAYVVVTLNYDTILLREILLRLLCSRHMLFHLLGFLSLICLKFDNNFPLSIDNICAYYMIFLLQKAWFFISSKASATGCRWRSNFRTCDQMWHSGSILRLQ